MQQQLPDLVFPIFNSKRNSQKTVNFDIKDYVNKNELSTQILSGQLSTPSLTTQSIQFNGSTQNIGFTNEDKNNLDTLNDDTRTDENEIKLTDISYNESILKTTIDNNCHINNLTCGNVNVSHIINTTGNLQNQINNINSAANAITYNSNTQTTSISNSLNTNYFTATNITTSNLTCTNLTTDNFTSSKTTDLQNQINNILNFLIPVGSIMMYGSDADPVGRWMKCKGQLLLKTNFPELWDAIGHTYLKGRSVISTQFYICDMRGLFVRGYGTNTTYTESVIKGAATFGQFQNNTVQAHTHLYYRPSTDRNVLDDANATGLSRETVWDDVNNSAETQLNETDLINETKPHNISLNYIIKY